MTLPRAGFELRAGRTALRMSARVGVDSHGRPLAGLRLHNTLAAALVGAALFAAGRPVALSMPFRTRRLQLDVPVLSGGGQATTLEGKVTATVRLRRHGAAGLEVDLCSLSELLRLRSAC